MTCCLNLNKVPDNAVLMTAGVVGLFLTIAHNEGQVILKKNSLIVLMKNKFLLKIWSK